MTNTDVVKNLPVAECQWFADQCLSFALTALRDGNVNLAIADLRAALSAANRAKNMRQAGKIIHAIGRVKQVQG